LSWYSVKSPISTPQIENFVSDLRFAQNKKTFEMEVLTSSSLSGSTELPAQGLRAEGSSEVDGSSRARAIFTLEIKTLLLE